LENANNMDENLKLRKLIRESLNSILENLSPDEITKIDAETLASEIRNKIMTEQTEKAG
jgi:hypothetical protein